MKIVWDIIDNQWINSGGEYQYERRIVRDKEKEVDLID